MSAPRRTWPVLLLSAFLVPALCLPAFARQRIETGQDLAEVCQLAVEHRMMKPDTPMPVRARLCAKYINGYFGALEALHGTRGTYKEHTQDEAGYIQCAQVSRMSYMDELEKKVARAAEWHPEILSRPAVELVEEAFNVLDPC